MKKKTPTKSNNLQEQKQLSMQKVVQDQAYSYNIIGGSLSAFECYANKCQTDESKKTNIFSAYNNFNCGNTKTKDQLKDQIIVQLIILNSSIQLYTIDHGKYVFPKNLSKEKIIEHLEQWKQSVPDDAQKYYQSAIDIFKGKTPESYEKELETDKKELNPNWFISQIDVIHQANKKGDDAVKKFDKEGVLPEMVLNSDKVGDEDINSSSKNEIQRRKDQIEIDELLDEVENALHMFVCKDKRGDSEKVIEVNIIREKKKSKGENDKEGNLNKKEMKEQNKAINEEMKFNESIMKFSECYDKFIEKYQIYIYRNTKKEHSHKVEKMEKEFHKINTTTKINKRDFQTILHNLNPSSLL